MKIKIIITRYVNDLFSELSLTEQLLQLKLQISSNLAHRIHGLIEKGIKEDVAIDQALDAMGDLESLIDRIKKEQSSGQFHNATIDFSLSCSFYPLVYLYFPWMISY